MERISPSFESEYLNKHVEDFDRDSAESSLTLARESSGTEYKDSGTTELQIGDTTIILDYYKTALPQELQKYYQGQEFYEISRLCLHRNIGENQTDLEVTDLCDDAPVILFSPLFNGSLKRFPEINTIVIASDILNPYNILNLFHEIGHVVAMDNKSLTERDKLWNARNSVNKERSVENENQAIDILQNERDAWAFALNKLRPFLKPGDSEKPLLYPDAIKKYIHGLALGSYSRMIKRSLTESSISLDSEISKSDVAVDEALGGEKAA